MDTGIRSKAGFVLAVGAFLLPLTSLHAAEFVSADALAKQANASFHEGDYKRSAKLWQKAVRQDPSNADYHEGLGKAYEREAETSSFPFLLTGKARENFVRALELNPKHASAMVDLIELQQQPIGLCEGNLAEASNLIDRLASVDPVAAARQREYWLDAQQEAGRPGQKALCGPVKLSRALTEHVFPGGQIQAAPPEAPAIAVAANRPDGSSGN